MGDFNKKGIRKPYIYWLKDSERLLISEGGLLMKNLIYIWVNNYKNIIIQQGFQLSPEILIKTEASSSKDAEDIEISVHMTDNRSHIVKNFYGQNISSVMAFVGKNGSGKTMVSRMLLEFLPDGLKSNDSLNNLEGLQSLGIISKWDNKALYVLYDDEKDVVSVCPNNVRVSIPKESDMDGIKLEIISQDEVYRKLCSTIKLGIYLTNVFNPSELLESYHKLDLGNGSIKFQQTYSPAFILKHEAEEQTKSLYGYQCNNNKYIGVMQKYAQGQISSLSFAYMNKQAELFLKSYKHIPDRLKHDLHIYQEFDLDVIEFGTYSEVYPYVNLDGDGSFKESYNSLEPHEKILIEAKGFYISKINKFGNNVLMLLYFNMLLEVYGVLWNVKSIKQQIFELFNGEITGINNDILIYIKNFLLSSKNSELQSSDWVNQISEFIDFLLMPSLKNWVGETGNRSFDENNFLEWYYAEITKKTSFVKRNLIFRWKPTSSGEMAIANLFAYLDDAIGNLKIVNDKKNILLILDELDCYLHPKWQQYIVKLFLDRLQEYTKYTFQLVITTHSPIILSDLCNDNILKLGKLDNFQAQLEAKKTFGADISHLYYDSFFMDEGDIGDFAKQNIGYVINALKNEDLTEKEKLLFIINNIGQDIVREKLHVQYQTLQHRKQLSDRKADSLKMAERIHALDDGRREKILNYINEMENL